MGFEDYVVQPAVHGFGLQPCVLVSPSYKEEHYIVIILQHFGSFKDGPEFMGPAQIPGIAHYELPGEMPFQSQGIWLG